MEKLNKNQKRILEEMKKNPKVSKRDLSFILDLSETSVSRNIRKLRERDILKRVGPNHRGVARGHWEILK